MPKPQKTFDACENAGSPDFCSFVTLRTAGEVGFDVFFFNGGFEWCVALPKLGDLVGKDL